MSDPVRRCRKCGHAMGLQKRMIISIGITVMWYCRDCRKSEFLSENEKHLERSLAMPINPVRPSSPSPNK